jgi:4-alpha-glucanotransferase
MNDNSSQASLPPFPTDYRASGLLLHMTSLPSTYGIGDVGPAALAWVDRHHDAGQSWWQALPLGPTGYGNSPYQSLSSFAGNWRWRCTEDMLSASAFPWLRALMESSTRSGALPGPLAGHRRADSSSPLHSRVFPR